MRLRSIIFAVVVCAFPWTVRAQPIQGVFVGGGAGLLVQAPTKNTSLTPGLSGSDYSIEHHLGYDGQLSVGYALGDGWRFELEGTVGHAGVNGISGTTFPATGSGSVRNWGLMANAVFDLDVGSPYIYPYLGLGAGYQSTRLNDFVLTSLSRPYSYSASGTQGGFAAQAIAGLSFPIPNMPGLSITADYRFMDIFGGEKFNGSTVLGSVPGTLPGTIKFHNQYDHIAMIGVRYAFNTPPPPPAAEPAAASPPAARTQTYEVYFDLNKFVLTDRARAVVNQAAAASTKNQSTRIDVTGNTDTSGNTVFNQALSHRRAKAVMAALVTDGVPRDQIAIHARGETNLAVPTGPGVVEARNRRVDIVLQ
jgi:outer membrane protein OmpA-like peptidoglycan-associated protein